jgi:tetratricopeptide (TPR) repeat protein
MGFLGNLYGFLGYYNHTRGHVEKALDWYARGAEKGMERPSYRLAHGVLLLRTGSFREAREIFSNLLVTGPRTGRIPLMAKLNIALAYWKLGEIDTAVEMMWEVHNKLGNSRTYGTLGYLLIASGDLEKALEFNMKALDYDDEDPVVLDNLGQIYYAMGDREEALKYFLKAEEEKDDQADTLYYLGCIYHEKGRIEEARRKLEKALECKLTSLNTVSRADIEEKLKELQESQGGV